MKKIMGKLIQLFTGSSEAYPKQYYPVGWILESSVNVNPSTFCIGKWELYGKGQVAACINSADSDFATAGKVIGEKTHKLTVNEMPAHTHSSSWFGGELTTTDQVAGNGIVYTGNPLSRETSSTGSSGAHNNIQPTIIIYRWKRVS